MLKKILTKNSYKLILSLSAVLLFVSCCARQQEKLHLTEHHTNQDSITSQVIGDHLTEKKLTLLSSEEGQKLFAEIKQSKFEKLNKNWVLQRKSYCGVCSSVIVTNTILNKKRLDQDNFFSTEVRKIIGPEIVSKMGLTLREINLALGKINPTVKVLKFPSNISGQDLLIDQLEKYNDDDSFMIVNFSIKSFQGQGMRRGHFSVVAGYNQKSKNILILEVNSNKHYWVKVRDLYTAMLAVDPVSRIPRGWVTLTP